MIQTDIPIVGFSAYSGTGKTTLLKQVVPLLKIRNIRIVVIKHAHHDFDLDQPGKDSFELRKSGADQTIICTKTRMAVITEFESPEQEPDLQHIVSSLDTNKIDLILVEGYKSQAFPKIELHRSALGKPYMHSHDANFIAIACDSETPSTAAIAVLDINSPQQIADFIYEEVYRAKCLA